MEPNLSSDADMTLGASLPGASSASAFGGKADDCQPLNCAKAMDCIDGARNPSTTSLQMGQLRGQLEDCAPCLQAFDMETKLRATISPNLSELPSADFRMRITETLAAVDLSQLDVGDIEF